MLFNPSQRSFAEDFPLVLQPRCDNGVWLRLWKEKMLMTLLRHYSFASESSTLTVSVPVFLWNYVIHRSHRECADSPVPKTGRHAYRAGESPLTANTPYLQTSSMTISEHHMRILPVRRWINHKRQCPLTGQWT